MWVEGGREGGQSAQAIDWMSVRSLLYKAIDALVTCKSRKPNACLCPRCNSVRVSILWPRRRVEEDERGGREASHEEERLAALVVLCLSCPHNTTSVLTSPHHTPHTYRGT